MASLPGYAGIPVVGDKSMEFYKDAVAFVDKRIEQYQSRIFLARVLNKHTVFVASHSGVRQVLHESKGCLELGYKSFMHSVYGDNVVFADGVEAETLRTVLQGLFTEAKTLSEFQVIIDRLTARNLDTLRKGEASMIYPFLKMLCTEICLSLFLNLDFQTSASLAEDIVQLTTTHWHGIISVPVSVRIPGVGGSSTYTKAIQAKDKLLEVIQKRLESCSRGFPARIIQTDFPKATDASNHVLLLTSALVPKALASILTSFVLTTGTNKEWREQMLHDKGFLQCVLLEVQRMWPPFFGGRRLVRKEMKIGGYKIEKGCAVVYMTRHAQRDPEVFQDPDTFDPHRWSGRNAGDKDKLYLFGGGPRCCIGQQIVGQILKTISWSLLETFDWTTNESPDSISYKWLPVSRPIEHIPVTFSSRKSRENEIATELEETVL